MGRREWKMCPFCDDCKLVYLWMPSVVQVCYVKSNRRELYLTFLTSFCSDDSFQNREHWNVYLLDQKSFCCCCSSIPCILSTQVSFQHMDRLRFLASYVVRGGHVEESCWWQEGWRKCEPCLCLGLKTLGMLPPTWSLSHRRHQWGPSFDPAGGGDPWKTAEPHEGRKLNSSLVSKKFISLFFGCSTIRPLCHKSLCYGCPIPVYALLELTF